MKFILQVSAGVVGGFVLFLLFALFINGGWRTASEILLDIFPQVPNTILKIIKFIVLMALAWVPIILIWNFIPDDIVYRAIFMIPASIYLLSIYFYGDK
jgi:hypothetical protein